MVVTDDCDCDCDCGLAIAGPLATPLAGLSSAHRFPAPRLPLLERRFRQLDLAPFDLLFWPHLLVNPLSAPGRSEALRRP